MGTRLSARSLYGRIGRTYLAWAPSLLPLALIVFLPLGLVEALSEHIEIGERQLGNGFLLAGTVVAVLAVVGTSLFGEILYAGAVAVSLTHDHDGGPPTLRQIAAHLAWWRLLGVDLLFAALVLAGFAALVLPGIVLYVWFSLAGPIVEIEGRGLRASFARSRQLVRGRFWLVLAVVGPIEVASEAVGEAATAAAGALLGHGLLAEWAAASASNVLTTPFLAVAFVLLAVGLIAEKEGRAPRLHSAPMSR